MQRLRRFDRPIIAAALKRYPDTNRSVSALQGDAARRVSTDLDLLRTENRELRTALHSPAKEDLRVLTDNRVAGERAFRLVPLIDPVDHAEQCESRSARRDLRGRTAVPLHVTNQVLDEVYVIFLARIDFAPEPGRQRMILVQHDRDLAVFLADYHFDVQPDERAQALFRALDAAR